MYCIVLILCINSNFSVSAKSAGDVKLLVNPEKTIGLILYELSDDAQEWHIAVEQREFAISLISLDVSYIKRGLRFILSSTGNYSVTYKGTVLHDEACNFIRADPVEAYGYFLFEAC